MGPFPILRRPWSISPHPKAAPKLDNLRRVAFQTVSLVLTTLHRDGLLPQIRVEWGACAVAASTRAGVTLMKSVSRLAAYAEDCLGMPARAELPPRQSCLRRIPLKQSRPRENELKQSRLRRNALKRTTA
ncbi:hypothetical protein CTAM01_16568 [Colletotrichum tamarilloi]|uniref:Uncharacterized protein n=1 Tax=Colletotrichum tamarilloi TaxID=1209934 RepID=A0ABQ9QI41_9PEZI|nr:uncharacterized protein CTAM01_16568 [Colletotrichum tamarilloi]KAK1471351.1 hypothetical protein CTAM01_16568 [Colletotrichum tamarilloi]